MAATNGKLNGDFRAEEVSSRGHTFSIKELTAGAYDEIVAMHTKGPDETIDSSAVVRSMTVASLVEPKLSLDQLMELPYSVYAKLVGAVNRMHFGGGDEEAPGDEKAPNA